MNWLSPHRQRHRTPVVVVGLGMTGLGVVRSLAREGVPIVAVDNVPRRASSWTRLCRKVFVDGTRGEDFWTTVIDVGRTCGSPAPVLILTHDLAVLEASERRERLSRVFRFHLPDPPVVQLLMDKLSFSKYAERHDLPVPRSLHVREPADWEQVLADHLLPCVIKPKYRSSAWVAAAHPKAFRVHGEDALRALILRLGNVEADYIVQEWIPGPDSEVHFYLAYRDGSGRTVASFSGRKLRQWPPLVGSTSIAERADCAPVEREASRLFDLVRFRGLGSVEFKHDARTGCFRITEATVGRPNLQSEVATANGVNIVYRAYCDLSGEPAGETREQPRNTRWVYIDNDLSSALHYLRRHELSWRGFLKSYRGPRYYADLSWHDPLPFLMILVRILSTAVRRVLPGSAASPEEKMLN